MVSTFKQKIQKKLWAKTLQGRLSLNKAHRKYMKSKHGKDMRKNYPSQIKYNISLKAKENYRRGQEKYRNTPHGKFMLARKAATGKRQHIWEIKENEYLKLMDQKCFYCNGPLPPCGIGLDRMDSAKEYTMDNVVPCCSICNRAKGNWWTVEEAKAAIQAVLRYRRDRAAETNSVSKCSSTN